MKTKNKLIAIIASLMLVGGLSIFPPVINQARAGGGDEGPCDTFHNDQGNPCYGNPTNCFCEIIITPEQ